MNQNMIAQWRARQSQSSYLDDQTGTIVSWTNVYVAPEPFEGQVPYILAIIALADGRQIICPIADAEEDELTIGARVHFVTRIINCPKSNSIITYGTKAVVISKN